MSFTKEYNRIKEQVEELLKPAESYFNGFPEPLKSAVRYGYFGGGKRIRPLLFYVSYQLFQNEMQNSAQNLMQAIECIHSYSLIHDDLPCMDNDDLRRGKPTCHKVFGEANALLAGDALLNVAYELMFNAVANSDNPQLTARASSCIAKAAGGAGMIGGQTLDLLPETSTDGKRLTYVYQHKTADLITASVVSGAIMAQASDDDIENLKTFGDAFGLVFQLTDDFIDIEQESEKNKSTYANIYGKRNMKITLADCASTALQSLKRVSADTEFLRKLTLKITNRDE